MGAVRITGNHRMMELPVQVTTDDVHAHARHTGHRGLDLVLALSAIFISLVSLFIAIEHGCTERDLVAANSWPYLQIETDMGRTSGIQFWITNAGVGPAKLELFEVSYAKHPVSSARELMQLCCGLPAGPARSDNDLPGFEAGDINDSVLRPGQRMPILIASSPAGTLIGQLRQASGQIRFRGCYCSVFDECWMSDLVDLHARRVKACPVSDRPFNRSPINR